MKENFNERVQTDINNIINVLCDDGNIEFVDDNYLEYSDDDFTFGIALYPAILSYSKGGKGVPVELVTEIWIALDIEGDRKEIGHFCDKLKELLKTCPIKPFKDEDAYLGMFKRPNDFTAICYLNPDHPNGYWSNHTLD